MNIREKEQTNAHAFQNQKLVLTGVRQQVICGIPSHGDTARRVARIPSPDALHTVHEIDNSTKYLSSQKSS